MATFPREWAHGGSAIVEDVRHQLSSEFTLASRCPLQTGTAWVAATSWTEERGGAFHSAGAYWAGVPCAVGSVLEPIQEKRMCSGTVRKTLAASVAIPRCTRGCQVHSSPTCAASELLRTRHDLTQGATIWRAQRWVVVVITVRATTKEERGNRIHCRRVSFLVGPCIMFELMFQETSRCENVQCRFIALPRSVSSI